MIIGSHNSWSYLKPSKWWMRTFAFMARCQDLDIRAQYGKCHVRCFDLRVRFKGNRLIVAHGRMEYAIDEDELFEDLQWLNRQGGCYVRVLHEVRDEKSHDASSILSFGNFCAYLERMFTNIIFWGGRNLYDWKVDYQFEAEPSCEERYSSVCAPRWLDDWWPRIYAKFHNKKILKEGTDKEILLMDFVNYIK